MFTTIDRGALGSRLAVAVAAGAIGFGAADTAAYASIPDNNGVINGCRNSIGVLRVIDTASTDPFRGKCFGTETALTWNEKGSPGPVGPLGRPGPAGSAGPPGSSSGLTFYTKLAGGVEDVRCDGSDIATGGGASLFTFNPAEPPAVLQTSTPIIEGGGLTGKPVGWSVKRAGGGPSSSQIVRVICAHQN